MDFEDDTNSPSGSIPGTPVHGSSTHGPKKLHLYDSREVAAELSMMDGELLRKIDPDELKHGAWMKKNKVGRTFGAFGVFSLFGVAQGRA